MDNGLFSNVIRHALILRMVCHYGIRSHSTKKLFWMMYLHYKYDLLLLKLSEVDQIILTYFVRGNITVPLVDILFDWMGRN